MAREIASCGTASGYERHRLAGEPQCRPCLDGMALAKRKRRAARAKEAEKVNGRKPRRPKLPSYDIPEANPDVTVDGDFDEEFDLQLEDAIANYHIVTKAMTSSELLGPLAGLSKRRQELVDFICVRRAEIRAGEVEEDNGGGDEFSQRRADRIARRADRRSAASN